MGGETGQIGNVEAEVFQVLREEAERHEWDWRKDARKGGPFGGAAARKDV